MKRSQNDFQIAIGIAIAISISTEDRVWDRDLIFGDRGHGLFQTHHCRGPERARSFKYILPLDLTEISLS